MSPLLILVFVGILSVRVESSCMYALPDPGADGCVYNGHHIATGDSYRDMDRCFSCSCGTDNSMQCCGFGHQAGVFEIPDGCYMLKNGCNFKIVNAQDHSKSCVTTVIG
ncbi:beta-microseminoprotein-like [Ylistrum balloti]|uniref:beta-microseminoprotein-like n=1 Tax=Ylistrum balloti TaxID=509963 RepID=UPI002905C819|nr:beta-microseminoprotein-like [Ylistrum balloti]